MNIGDRWVDALGCVGRGGDDDFTLRCALNIENGRKTIHEHDVLLLLYINCEMESVIVERNMYFTFIYFPFPFGKEKRKMK